MIAKSCGQIEHMSCKCGRHPQLMQTTVQGNTRWYVESVCCRTITVLLSAPERAINEYNRIRAVQDEDEYMEYNYPLPRIQTALGLALRGIS